MDVENKNSSINATVCRPDFTRNKKRPRQTTRSPRHRYNTQDHNDRVMVLAAKVKQWRGGVIIMVLWIACRV